MADNSDYETPPFVMESIEAFVNDYFERKTGMNPNVEIDLGPYHALFWAEKGNIDYGGWEIIEGDVDKREREFKDEGYSVFSYPAVGNLNEYIPIKTVVEPSERDYDLLGGLTIGDESQAGKIYSFNLPDNPPIVINPKRITHEKEEDSPEKCFLWAVFHETAHECTKDGAFGERHRELQRKSCENSKEEKRWFDAFDETLGEIVGENFSRDILNIEKRKNFTEEYEEDRKIVEEIKETLEKNGREEAEDILEKEDMSWAKVVGKKYYGRDKKAYETRKRFEDLLKKYRTGEIVKKIMEISSKEEFFELT